MEGRLGRKYDFKKETVKSEKTSLVKTISNIKKKRFHLKLYNINILPEL